MRSAIVENALSRLTDEGCGVQSSGEESSDEDFVEMESRPEVVNASAEVKISQQEDYAALKIKNALVLHYILRLLSISLTFNQVSRAVAVSRSTLGVTARLPPITRSEVTDIARQICAIGMDCLARILEESWSYCLAFDGGDDKGSIDFFDARARVFG